jgi:hypothetical protein
MQVYWKKDSLNTSRNFIVSRTSIFPCNRVCQVTQQRAIKYERWLGTRLSNHPHPSSKPASLPPFDGRRHPCRVSPNSACVGGRLIDSVRENSVIVSAENDFGLRVFQRGQERQHTFHSTRMDPKKLPAEFSVRMKELAPSWITS